MDMPTRRIVLRVDADDGRLLDATDEMTGEAVPYGIERVGPDERKKFSDAKKIIFERDEDRDEYSLLARFFGQFLCLADQIRVCAVGTPGGLPTACSYRFPPTGRKTRLPMRFDYATCRLAIPVRVDRENHARAAAVARRVALESRAEFGHGHPGLTNDKKELAVLEARAWRDVAEDVIATPYRENYANDWFPALREDGRVGLYVRDDSSDAAYVVVDNALPHFACDQMRVLFSENPNGLTWEEWKTTGTKKNTMILDRAVELSRAVAEEIASRVVDELGTEGLVAKVEGGGGGGGGGGANERIQTIVNRLVRLSNGEVRYDAGVTRGSQFSSERNRDPKALFRVGNEGYAIVAKMGHARRDEDVFPANARDEDEMRALVEEMNGRYNGKAYDPPVFLREPVAPEERRDE